MKILGDTLSELGGIISDLFASGFDDLGNVSFGDSMKSFVADIRSLIDDVLPSLATSFETIATALKPIAWIVDKFGSIPSPSENGRSPWDPLGLKDYDTDAAVQELNGRLQESLKTGLDAGTALGADTFIPTDIGEAVKNQIVTGINASKEEQQAALRSAFTPQGVDTAVSNQLATQVTAAVEGAKQAMAGLAPEVQAQVDLAMAPLGDIAGRIGTAFDGVGPLIRGSLGQIPGIVAEVFNGITPTVATSVQGITNAFVTGGAAIISEVEGWGPRITAPLQGLAGTMQIIGTDIANGLAAGIRAGTQVAVDAAAAMASAVEAASRTELKTKSPSRVFMEIGDNVSQGLGIGIQNGADGPIAAIKAILEAIKEVFGSASGINLNFNMGQMSNSMSSIAADAQTFSNSMISAGKSTGSGKVDPATKQQMAQIDVEKARLDLQIKELQAQKNLVSGPQKAALQQQIDMLGIQKQRLTQTEKELEYAAKYENSMSGISDAQNTAMMGLAKVPWDFANATADQAMSDLNIGGGAITGGLKAGLDMASNFIFNVSSADDAIAIKNNQINKQSLGMVGR
jgi:hypothetical protein